MKIIRNMLRKCWAPTHHGNPWFSSASGVRVVPGLRAMNRSTDGLFRRPLATATALMSTTKPTGISQSRLNHRLRPKRTWGAVPCCWGIDPAQVVGSIDSSPMVKLE